MNYTIIDKDGNEITTSYDFCNDFDSPEDASFVAIDFSDWENAEHEEDFRAAYDVAGDAEVLADWNRIWLWNDDGAWTIERDEDGCEWEKSGWEGDYREYFTREEYEVNLEFDGKESLDHQLKIRKAEKISGYSSYPSTMQGIWGTMRECFGDSLNDMIEDLDVETLGAMLRLAKFAFEKGRHADER